MKAIMAGALMVMSVTLAACATATLEPGQSEQAKEESMTDWIGCVHANARWLDDGRSDATTIAMMLRSVCGPLFEESLETYARGLSPRARRAFLSGNRLEDYFIQTATRAVLDARAGR